MYYLKQKTWIAAVIASALLVAHPAGAVDPEDLCDRSSFSSSELALWTAHAGCDLDFVDWHVEAYDWNEIFPKSDRGLSEPCNLNKEYAKHWNAAFLIQDSAIRFQDPPGTIIIPGYAGRAFHSGTFDYLRLVRGHAPSGWHQLQAHRAAGASAHPENVGAYAEHNSQDNFVAEILTFCPVYNATIQPDPTMPPSANPVSDPAFRANVLVHEGMHAVLEWNDWDPAHTQTCTIPTPDPGDVDPTRKCDGYYFHTKEAFTGGDIRELEGTNRFHSAFQAGYEFLCDLMDRPGHWVPTDVRQGAQVAYNSLQVGAFVNGPPPACGIPSPMLGPPVDPGSIDCGVIGPCVGDTDCDSGEFCNAGCCATTPK